MSGFILQYVAYFKLYVYQEELKEWDQCLLMLGDAKVDEHGNVNDTKDSNVMYLDKDGEDREINVNSVPFSYILSFKTLGCAVNDIHTSHTIFPPLDTASCYVNS